MDIKTNSFKAIGDFCNGRTAKDLTADILALL